MTAKRKATQRLTEIEVSTLQDGDVIRERDMVGAVLRIQASPEFPAIRLIWWRAEGDDEAKSRLIVRAVDEHVTLVRRAGDEP